MVRRLRLRDLVLVMRKHQVDAAGMNVQRVPEISLAHRRALDVPARPAAPKRCVPGSTDLLITPMRVLPQGEVADRLFVVLVGGNPRTCAQTGAVQARELAVTREARDAEVHIAV